MMKGQFAAYPISGVMVLGAAGGNGLENIIKSKFEKVSQPAVKCDRLNDINYGRCLLFPDLIKRYDKIKNRSL